MSEANARVLTEWGAGKSALEIGRELGMSKGTVSGIIDRSSGPDAEKAKADHPRNKPNHKASKSRRRKDPERDERVLALWADGESATQIGAALGVTRNTVIGIVSRSGEAGSRSPGRESKSARVVAASQRTPKRPEPVTPRPTANPFVVLQKRGAAFRQPPQLSLVSSVELPIAHPEPPGDLYAHMRSEDGLRRAIAAMTRPPRDIRDGQGVSE